MEYTPIHKLNYSDGKNNYYIKRDDLFPVSFGGNKARKALLFFEDFKIKKADCIVTYGSSSSNHCRIIANLAISKGIPCYVIAPNESSAPTFNSKLIKLFGATVIHCPVSEVNKTIRRKLEELSLSGYNPYFIQGGGHGDIGTHAYVQAYKEIKTYEKLHGIDFDYIFHTSGTGTTQAGLVCGKLIYGDKKEIVGISIARGKKYGGKVILDSVNSYLKSLDMDLATNEAISFIDDYLLDGYGFYNKQILHTIKKFTIQDGIPLDTTYTGKAFWGMTEYIKRNNIIGKKILFIHTGGTPLFFDNLEELIHER